MSSRDSTDADAPEGVLVRSLILVVLFIFLLWGVRQLPYGRLADLAGAKRVTLETPIWSEFIGISADRSQVVFTVQDLDLPRSSASFRAIWRLDIDSGRIKILDKGHVIYREHLRFVEDEDRILYLSRDNNDYYKRPDLRSVDLRGRKKVLERDAPDRALDEAFDPDLVAAVSLARTQAEASIEEGWRVLDEHLITLAGDRNHFTFAAEPASEGDSSPARADPWSEGDSTPARRVVAVATLRPPEIIAQFENFTWGELSPDGRFLILGHIAQGPGRGQSTMTVFDTVQRELFSVIVETQYRHPNSRTYPQAMVTMLHYNDSSGSANWSPDSRRVLLIEHEKSVEAGVDGDIIWVVDLEERRVVQEFRGAFYPHRIVWSPDGRWLATKAHYVPGNDTVSHGWLLDLETGERIQLPIQSVEAVAWLDEETVLWATRAPWRNKTVVPALEFFTSKLGQTDIKRIYPR